MTFLQQAMLWGLFAVSIPVIIHLLNRRRFRTVEWGAMQFLLKATRDSRGKKRLKHILILLMRSLAVAALVFAIARPLAGGFLGWGGGQVETVVLILDRSASMERSEKDIQVTKRKSVLTKVAGAMNELEGARLVVIDSATGKAQEVPSPDVLPELSFTAPTDSGADIPGASRRSRQKPRRQPHAGPCPGPVLGARAPGSPETGRRASAPQTRDQSGGSA